MTSERVLNRYELFLDSHQRTSSSQYVYPQFNLTIPISRTNAYSHFRVRVNDVQLPYSFRAVNIYNQILNITIVRGSTTATTITLAEGNYSIIALLAQLKTKLTTKMDALFVGWSSTNSFTFSYSNQTNQITLAVTDSVSCSITLSFTLNQTLGVMFGSYLTDLTFTDTTPATSSYQVNVNYQKVLYLRCDSLQFKNNFEAICSSYKQSDVLCKIPLTSNPTYYILWENPTQRFLDITNESIDILHFYLTTSYSFDSIDLELDWSITLEVEEVLPAMEESEKKEHYTQQQLYSNPIGEPLPSAQHVLQTSNNPSIVEPDEPQRPQPSETDAIENRIVDPHRETDASRKLTSVLKGLNKLTRAINHND